MSKDEEHQVPPPEVRDMVRELQATGERMRCAAERIDETISGSLPRIFDTFLEQFGEQVDRLENMVQPRVVVTARHTIGDSACPDFPEMCMCGSQPGEKDG